MADEPNATPVGDDPKPKKPGSKMLIIVMVLLLLAGAAGGWYWFRSRKAHAAAPAKPAVVLSEVNAVMHLEGFTVNLADKDQSCYLRLGVDLGLGHDVPGGKEGEKAAELTPMVRDTLLGVLSTWTADQLLAPDGKTKLKADVLKALQDRSPQLDVKEVYFTDFLVQR